MPRPRVPTELKLLRGNPGKERIHPEVRPLRPRELPDPPEFLTREAKDEWWRIADELHRLGILTVVDLNPLAAYCQAFGRWSIAETALARMAENDALTSALMIRNTAGGPQQNPLVKIATNAARDMVRYASEFGLTPVARARIASAEATEPAGSKFKGLLAG